VARGRVALAGIAEPDDDAVDTRRLISASEQLRESRHAHSQTPKGPVHADGATDRLFEVNDSVRDLPRGALVDRIQDENDLVGAGFAHLMQM